jgi:Arc/MetJ family transcription regulator
MAVRQHTTLNLDMGLVAEAQRILGTTRTTETIHRALQEVINREKRQRLLDMGIGDLTPQRLEEMRQNRFSDSADASRS